jgi:hypothetical protein
MIAVVLNIVAPPIPILMTGEVIQLIAYVLDPGKVKAEL